MIVEIYGHWLSLSAITQVETIQNGTEKTKIHMSDGSSIIIQETAQNVVAAINQLAASS